MIVVRLLVFLLVLGFVMFVIRGAVGQEVLGADGFPVDWHAEDFAVAATIRA